MRRRSDDRAPLPDMQALVEHYGTYDLVPPEVWADFEEAKHRWWSDYVRDLKVPDPKKSKCNGVSWRERQTWWFR